MNDRPAPLADSVVCIEPEHDTDGGDCWCGPTPRRVVRDDGTDAGWVIVHHSLRGDELSDPPVSP